MKRELRTRWKLRHEDWYLYSDQRGVYQPPTPIDTLPVEAVISADESWAELSEDGKVVAVYVRHEVVA